MRLSRIFFAACLAWGLSLALGETKLGSLKSAAGAAGSSADSAKAAAAVAARKKVDSIKADAEAKAKRAADSIKALAEAAAKRAADSAKAAADALLKTKKDEAKPAPVPVAPKAEVIEAKPEPKAPVAPAGCGVAKIGFGAGIENRELQGEASEFEVAVGRVHCWVRLACGSGAIKVRHVWYKDGAKTQDVTLSCQSGSGRVWSNAPVSSGKWKVEVLKETGESMGSGEFTVK